MAGRQLNEKGIALPLVVVFIAVMSLLGVSLGYFLEGATVGARRQALREKALHYAEAGIHKCLWHLNKGFPLSEVLNATVPFEGGYYRLESLTPVTSPPPPLVRVRSTGWTEEAPELKRSVVAELRTPGYTTYMFLTGDEVNPDTKEKVHWVNGDVVSGDVHTNGLYYIYGDPRFKGKVTYSYSGPDPNPPSPYVYVKDKGAIMYKPGSVSNPVYEAGNPQKVPAVQFPSVNPRHLRDLAQQDGYYYKGRTCILLKGNQVVIRNKSGNAVTRPLPPNGVIYVASDGDALDPADGTGKGGSDWKMKFRLKRGNAFVSGTLDGRLTIAAENNIYITVKDPTYGGKNEWDAFDNAPYTGGVKYANTKVDPGPGQSDDFLGLVAQGRVRILHRYWPRFHPTDSSKYYWTGVTGYIKNKKDITIHAAILALNPNSGAFEFENYDGAPVLGYIHLVGSIAQTYQGLVAQVQTGTGKVLNGYHKNYKFDPRLRYETPPAFPVPPGAGWEVVSWAIEK